VSGCLLSHPWRDEAASWMGHPCVWDWFGKGNSRSNCNGKADPLRGWQPKGQRRLRLRWSCDAEGLSGGALRFGWDGWVLLGVGMGAVWI